MKWFLRLSRLNGLKAEVIVECEMKDGRTETGRLYNSATNMWIPDKWAFTYHGGNMDFPVYAVDRASQLPYLQKWLSMATIDSSSVDTFKQ